MEHCDMCKIAWFIKRFGWRELLAKPARRVLSPLMLSCLGKGRGFFINDKQYQFFFHNYNTTWANERCVEVAVGLDSLAAPVLEVGNVLKHYVPSLDHVVVDKYEGPLKLDVVDIEGEALYQTIVSISTLEHVGYDEKEVDPQKIYRALERLKRLLKPGGKLLVTWALGYNKDADKLAAPGGYDWTSVAYMQRVGYWYWWQASFDPSARYGSPYPFGNMIAIMTYER